MAPASGEQRGVQPRAQDGSTNARGRESVWPCTVWPELNCLAFFAVLILSQNL